MKLLESIKLKMRANKYKKKDDPGGIAYIINTVTNGQTVFDIGAHKAGYLYFFLQQAGINGKIYAFEPQSNLYNYIVNCKKIFGWKNVVVEQLALSDSDSSTTLYIPVNKVSKGSAPGATIVSPGEQLFNGITETVKTQTLDNYCKINNIQPDFLKIDVEGNELKIFNGATEILKKYKPKIIVEIETRHVGKQKVRETFDFLKSMGYNGRFIKGQTFLALDFFDFDKYQSLDDKANYCNNFIFE